MNFPWVLDAPWKVFTRRRRLLYLAKKDPRAPRVFRKARGGRKKMESMLTLRGEGCKNNVKNYNFPMFLEKNKAHWVYKCSTSCVPAWTKCSLKVIFLNALWYWMSAKYLRRQNMLLEWNTFRNHSQTPMPYLWFPPGLSNPFKNILWWMLI